MMCSDVNNEININSEQEVVHRIRLEQILPDPEQPRKYFSEEEENKLLESIKKYGLQQPILLRPIEHANYDYIIVHGERRFRAHRKLGLDTIDALIRDMEESVVSDIQLIENIQRSSLSDIELAWEFRRRVKQGQTHEEIAQVIGKTRTFVTQRLGLLRLKESDQERIMKGDLTFSQARALLSVKNQELREKLSSKIDSETTLKETKKIIKEETKQEANVTRVTYQGEVRVKDLEIFSVICENNGTLRQRAPRNKVIKACIETLKRLREIPQ